MTGSPADSSARPKKLKPYLWSIIIPILLVFVLNKHFVRDRVRANIDSGPILILVNSLPNLVEAITGTIVLAGMMITIKEYSTGFFRRLSDARVYLIAMLLAALFVVPQELNWINLDGNSVYDVYDLAASLIGLIIINRILTRFGYLTD